MRSVREEKIALNPDDDKRCLLENSTDTLPWGHYRTHVIAQNRLAGNRQKREEEATEEEEEKKVVRRDTKTAARVRGMVTKAPT